MDFTVTRADTASHALDVDVTFTQDQNFLGTSKLSQRVRIPANAASETLTLLTSDLAPMDGLGRDSLHALQGQ